MGHYYQDLDRPHFDYDLFTIDGIVDTYFRGPAFDPSRPYVACFGAAQTFGRFCARPFPAILTERFGFQFVNLGVGAAGPLWFDAPRYINLANKAEFVIFQVLSGRSESNSLFDNRASRGLMGVRKSDNKLMRFEEFIADLMKTESQDRIREIVSETRASYVANMITLLQRIDRPKILLWLSARTPEYQERFGAFWELLGDFPQLVNRPMIDALRPYVDSYVECVTSRGIPQKLWKSDQPMEATTLENGWLLNWYYPSPEMHQDAAGLLAPVCAPYFRTAPMPKADEVEKASTRFIILAEARTGSNLLRDLLRSQPGVFAGGEIFNYKILGRGVIPWYETGSSSDERAKVNSDERLLRLWQDDPAKYIDELIRVTEAWGYRAIGFKSMYYLPNPGDPAGRYLTDNKSIRVIHLKRRNLLRRRLSWERALATDKWEQLRGTEAQPLPAVTLPIYETIQEFINLEAKQKEYDECFKDHPMLELFYEDLAENPQAVGARALAFLGITPTRELEVRLEKTGVDPLRLSIANYDELKSSLTRWLSFFQEYDEMRSSLTRWLSFFEE